MSRPPTFVWVTEDHASGLALVTGRFVGSALRRVGVTGAYWSRSGRGFVVPLAQVADLVAALEAERIPVRCRERT